MGFRDPFHYRTCSEIDKGYPDLHTPKWNLKKIKKVKTTNLKLISNINVDPTKKRDFRIDTIWLAQLYFQRYFTQNSFQTNSPLVFMAACVHLACKANDTPRSLEFVIKHIYRLRYAREEAEAKKINDIMVYVEFKEKVLLAERALLYSFAFDFCTGDPFSYALKYNTLLNLMHQHDGEQALSWLTKAGIVTTLCLQHPPSTLAVVALWFAQHLTFGKVPVDQDGLEWWEKLGIEKQDRVALPPVTAEVIEDIHWQLVVELDEASLQNALKGSGRLPGATCSCKACRAHARRLESLEAHSAEAAATADTSAVQAVAAPEGQHAEPFPAKGPAEHSPGLASGLLEPDAAPGADAPRTGTAANPSTAAGAAAASDAVGAASASEQAAATQPPPGTASGAPSHIDQASSAYPVRPTGPGQASSMAPSSTPDVVASRALASTPTTLQNGHHQPLHQPLVPQMQTNASQQNSYAVGARQGQHQAAAAASARDHSKDPGTSASGAPQQQASADDGYRHQHGHLSGNAADDDDADSLEEGEIEEGEVLPDGGDAFANAGDADADAHGSAQTTYGKDSDPSDDVVNTSDRKRKRSASPDLDHATDRVAGAAQKRHIQMQQLQT